MERCEKCGREIASEQDGFTAFNLQKGYEEVRLCSVDCLESWANGKLAGMITALVLGLVLAIGLATSDMGAGGFLLFFLPYMIRQSWGRLTGLGEFFVFMILLLSTMTIVYPAYKLFQEIRDYSAIKQQIRDIRG